MVRANVRDMVSVRCGYGQGMSYDHDFTSLPPTLNSPLVVSKTRPSPTRSGRVKHGPAEGIVPSEHQSTGQSHAGYVEAYGPAYSILHLSVSQKVRRRDKVHK